MKALVLLFAITVAAKAAPFLVSDSYPTGVDPSLIPVSFIVNGLPGSPITVPAFQQNDGTMILHLDLANLSNGAFTVTASATNTFGGSSPDSPPFHFVKGVPSAPTNLRISPN